MTSSVFPGVQTRFRGHYFAVLDAGAQVLSWEPAGQLRVLWNSPLADFEPDQPVRGGIPVIFPWFGAGPDGNRSPNHGFARTATWQRESVTDDAEDRLRVRYRLRNEGFDWPEFEAELVADFGAKELSVSFAVTNTGQAEFSYEEALHTYLKVGDVTRITLDGLDGVSYRDTVPGAPDGLQVQAGPVAFTGRTDRIYLTGGPVTVNDPIFARTLNLRATGSANTVVWNPGEELGLTMADIGPHWPDFVCVEAANVAGDAVRLCPGEQHRLIQQISLG